MRYNTSAKLKFYYLFMLADGRCSAGENDKFDKICQTMKADDKDKQEVIDYCNKAISVFSDDNSAMVTAEISNLLSAYGSFLEKSDKAEVIWNLINLAYADGEYSEPEKRVVTFLLNCWKIDSVVFADFIDTVQTILALENEKQWLKTIGLSYDETFAKLRGIDEAISGLAKNIEILISEADLAIK